VQEIYLKRSTEMKAKLEKESKKEKLTKVRRTSELEGYQTDLLDLQRKI
jgi:hypothetical protein